MVFGLNPNMWTNPLRYKTKIIHKSLPFVSKTRVFSFTQSKCTVVEDVLDFTGAREKIIKDGSHTWHFFGVKNIGGYGVFDADSYREF